MFYFNLLVWHQFYNYLFNKSCKTVCFFKSEIKLSLATHLHIYNFLINCRVHYTMKDTSTYQKQMCSMVSIGNVTIIYQKAFHWTWEATLERNTLYEQNKCMVRQPLSSYLAYVIIGPKGLVLSTSRVCPQSFDKHS
jgi:hypothetical protein